MASLTNYFENREDPRPKPKFDYGDRVFGHWNSIPFIASVVRDQRPGLLVMTDLPMNFEGNARSVVQVTYKDVKKLVDF